MAGEFIPYGTTLYVAMRILDTCDASDILAELETTDCRALAGHATRFVGTTSLLADIVERVVRRLSDSDVYGQNVATWRLYNVALLMLLTTEDAELKAAYQQAIVAAPLRGNR